MTRLKKDSLVSILVEYGKVVNCFVDYFWKMPECPRIIDLPKPVIDIPSTWLSYRLRKDAAREAISMMKSSRAKKNTAHVKPVHKGRRMCVSSNIAILNAPKKAINYDMWLKLWCIGNKLFINIPIKLHKHFSDLDTAGKRLNYYIITEDYIQICFEIDTGPKKVGSNAVGVDTGINSLASLSTGEQLGTDVKGCIERVKRCKQGSKGQQKARRALKQKIDKVAKELITKEDLDLVVVENLKNLGHNSKVKRRLTKNIRRSIGSWNWKYWLRRVQLASELNRVSFRTVSPYYTSQTCHECGYVDRGNRYSEKFKCLSCDHEANADVNAAKNILNRFLMGKYGSHYKPYIVEGTSII